MELSEKQGTGPAKISQGIQWGNYGKYELEKKIEIDAWAPEHFSFNDILIAVSAWSVMCQIHKGTAV